jgi:hypothetical protein
VVLERAQDSVIDGILALGCRIVWAQYENGACSDQAGEYQLGPGADNCPMRSAAALHVGGEGWGLFRSLKDVEGQLLELVEVM